VVLGAVFGSILLVLLTIAVAVACKRKSWVKLEQKIMEHKRLKKARKPEGVSEHRMTDEAATAEEEVGFDTRTISTSIFSDRNTSCS
jgi:hypothetical protein